MKMSKKKNIPVGDVAGGEMKLQACMLKPETFGTGMCPALCFNWRGLLKCLFVAMGILRYRKEPKTP